MNMDFNIEIINNKRCLDFDIEIIKKKRQLPRTLLVLLTVFSLSALITLGYILYDNGILFR